MLLGCPAAPGQRTGAEKRTPSEPSPRPHIPCRPESSSTGRPGLGLPSHVQGTGSLGWCGLLGTRPKPLIGQETEAAPRRRASAGSCRLADKPVSLP